MAVLAEGRGVGGRRGRVVHQGEILLPKRRPPSEEGDGLRALTDDKRAGLEGGGAQDVRPSPDAQPVDQVALRPILIHVTIEARGDDARRRLGRHREVVLQTHPPLRVQPTSGVRVEQFLALLHPLQLAEEDLGLPDPIAEAAHLRPQPVREARAEGGVQVALRQGVDLVEAAHPQGLASDTAERPVQPRIREGQEDPALASPQGCGRLEDPQAEEEAAPEVLFRLHAPDDAPEVLRHEARRLPAPRRAPQHPQIREPSPVPRHVAPRLLVLPHVMADDDRLMRAQPEHRRRHAIAPWQRQDAPLEDAVDDHLVGGREELRGERPRAEPRLLEEARRGLFRAEAVAVH